MIEAEVSKENSQSSTIRWINKYICRKAGRNADEGRGGAHFEVTFGCSSDSSLWLRMHSLLSSALSNEAPLMQMSVPFFLPFFFLSLCVQAASGRRNAAETHNRDSQIMYGWRAPCVQNLYVFTPLRVVPDGAQRQKCFFFKAVRKEMQKKKKKEKYPWRLMLTHKLAQMFINDF